MIKSEGNLRGRWLYKVNMYIWRRSNEYEIKLAKIRHVFCALIGTCALYMRIFRYALYVQ